ncbi:MAG: tyrosine-type recombinase/integrase [Alphaproteobacteria bacterium]
MTQRVKKKITPEVLDNFLKGQEDIKVKDTEISGFYVWYYAVSGRKTFFMRYYAKEEKKERNIKIGCYPDIRLKEAREIAYEYKSSVIRGGNPVVEIKQQQEDAYQEKANNLKVKVVLQEYLTEYTARYNKPRTLEIQKGIIKRFINKEIGNIFIKELKLLDINKLVSKVGAKTPAQANQCKALLSCFLNWCEDYGYRELNSNPCRKIKKFKLKVRDRVLSFEEYGRLFDAIEKGKEYDIYASSSFDIIKFLAITGCRLSEAKDLKWVEVDFNNSLLRLLDSKTGEKAVPIGNEALNILKEAYKKKSCEYVFPSSKHAGQPFFDVRRPWFFIRKEAKLDGLRIHDLRHSFATAGSMMGENIAVIGSVLGHRQISTTQRYTHINNIAGIEVANKISSKIIQMSKQYSEDCNLLVANA